MVSQKLSWVGLSVGDYVIKELLGEGSFSWVFRAVHLDGYTNRAIKVAKPPEAVIEGGPTSCIPTRAIVQNAGALGEVIPDTEQLLIKQARKLQSVSDPSLVVIEDLSQRQGGCYYRMPVVLGHTLRMYMTGGPVPVDVLLDVALCLDRLTEEDAFAYHGDLKPENIMITPAGVVLLDPGYFGSLDCDKGGSKQMMDNLAITTPSYYPMLKPDDIFALGLIMWELALRDQPLSKRAYSYDFDRKHVGDELWEWIRNAESEGKYFLSALMGIRPPSQIRPGLPPEVEEVLLKTLRIKFDNESKLDLSEGYRTFSELATGLARLLSKNIRYL